MKTYSYSRTYILNNFVIIKCHEILHKCVYIWVTEVCTKLSQNVSLYHVNVYVLRKYITHYQQMYLHHKIYHESVYKLSQNVSKCHEICNKNMFICHENTYKTYNINIFKKNGLVFYKCKIIEMV